MLHHLFTNGSKNSIITLPSVKKSHQTGFACKLCLICAYFSPDSDGSNVLKLKMYFMMYSTQRFNSQDIDGLESYELLLDYCDVLSDVWTLILTAPIHCR